MDNFLGNLAALSLGGAAAVAFGALLRQLTQTRYAAKWRCWVWLALCVRLLFPVPLGNMLPFQPIFLDVPENIVITAPETVPESAPAPSAAVPEREPLRQEATLPEPGKTSEAAHPNIRLYDVLAVLWAVGAAAVLLWAAAAHLRFCTFLRRWSRPVEDLELLELYADLTHTMEIPEPPKLRLCAGLAAPMLAGIFHHTILLPETPMDRQSLSHTLLHELSHFRRKDIRLKTLALAVCALHWFNPMVWYLNRMIAQDTELACDEALLQFLPKEEYGAYCRTILNSVQQIQQQKGARQ